MPTLAQGWACATQNMCGTVANQKRTNIIRALIISCAFSLRPITQIEILHLAIPNAAGPILSVSVPGISGSTNTRLGTMEQ